MNLFFKAVGCILLSAFILFLSFLAAVPFNEKAASSLSAVSSAVITAAENIRESGFLRSEP